MATVKYFRDGTTNSTRITITGGNQVIELTGLKLDLETHYFYVAFETAGGAVATPTGGTVTIEGKPEPDIDVWDAIPDGSFSATDVYSSTRTRPAIAGPLGAARLTLNNITGADRAVVRVVGY